MADVIDVIDLDAPLTMIVNDTHFQFGSMKSLSGAINAQVMKSIRHGSKSYAEEGRKAVINFFDRHCLGEVGVHRDKNALRQWKSGLDQGTKIAAAKFFSANALETEIEEDVGTLVELNAGFGEVTMRFSADKATWAKALHQAADRSVENKRRDIDYLRWYGIIRNLFAEYCVSVGGVAGLDKSRYQDMPSHWVVRTVMDLQLWSWEIE